MRKAFKNILIWSVALTSQFGLNKILRKSKNDNFLRVLLFHDIAPNAVTSFIEKIDYLYKKI